MVVVMVLDLLNAQVLAGTEPKEVGGGETIPNATLSPPE